VEQDLWFDFVARSMESSGLLEYHPPMASNPDVNVLPFGPYDAGTSGGGNWQFRTCLRLETSSSSVRDLAAMTLGSMFFISAANNQPGKIILVRGDGLGLTLTRTIGMLPSWYPWPPYIIYENVDPIAARSVAVAALSNNNLAEPAVQRLKKANPQFQFSGSASIADQLATLWMNNQLPGGLFVEAGEKIGACAPDSNGQIFFSELRMVDTVDPPATLFYNPAYFLALWEEMGWMKNIPPLSMLIDTSGPPAGTGVMQTVSGGGDHAITDAIAAASPGDTILIVDGLTYTDTVIIDKPINLTSTSLEPTDTPLPDYPVLDGQNGTASFHRPITVTNVNTGIAFIGKLSIKNGRATGGREDGGGILVEEANNVVISNCVISGCEAHGGGYFGEGFGGGIAAYHASPAILGCVVKFNLANSRGKGIGIFGYGWPTIVGTTIQANGSFEGGSNPRHDGGGIGIQISVTKFENAVVLGGIVELPNVILSATFNQIDLASARENYVRICRSTLEANIAADDGGGMYVTCASRVLLRHTDVLFNQAYSNGGGIRATFGSTLLLRDCLVEGNASQADEITLSSDGTEKKAGGGGIAARNMNLVDLVRTKIISNEAKGWAGGGISFVSTDEGSVAGWFLDMLIFFDWNDFLWDPLIYGHDHSILRIDAQSSIESNHATQLGQQLDNHGKGGGLYALRWSGPRTSGNTPPTEFKAANGDMQAWRSNIYVFSADMLKNSNQASFKESGFKETRRLYVENLVLPEKYIDEDITQDTLVYFL
jgi:hypothetical protein